MSSTHSEFESYRWQRLRRLERRLEAPMVVLGFGWLVLLIVELTRGLALVLELIGSAIWLVFVVEFVIRLLLAPRRRAFIVHNWLTVVALVVPAMRVFRVTRAVGLLRTFRAGRGVTLVRVLTAFSRGARSLGNALGRHGVGYVASLTVLVTVAGAAAMYAFEGVAHGGSMTSYGEALWWTAMVITSLGTDSWPKTTEGRVLSLILATYALGIFGYLAATIASIFVRRTRGPAGAANDDPTIVGLREEIAQLRLELRALRGRAEPPQQHRRNG